MHLKAKAERINRNVRSITDSIRFLTLPPTLSIEQMRFWHENGYLHLKGHAETEKIDAINRYIDDLWIRRQPSDPMITVDIFLGNPDGKRTHMHRAPIEAKAKPHKLNDLFLNSDEVRNLILNPNLTQTISYLLSGKATVINTLNFEYGSQQPYHTDTLYMPAPSDVGKTPRQCNMLATWIALEDCTLDAGPLKYYPGSHVIPAYRFSTGRTSEVVEEMEAYKRYMDREVEARGLKPHYLEAEAGDLFIWHELLFHGGAEIQNLSKTRKSLVTHYWSAHDLNETELIKVGSGYYLNRKPQPIKD
jgi:phytanoyl-CoA hydroxylase